MIPSSLSVTWAFSAALPVMPRSAAGSHERPDHGGALPSELGIIGRSAQALLLTRRGEADGREMWNSGRWSPRAVQGRGRAGAQGAGLLGEPSGPAALVDGPPEQVARRARLSRRRSDRRDGRAVLHRFS